MNFLFVDESGTSSFNDPDPVFSLVGIDLEDSKIRPLTYEYEKIKRYYFPRLFSTPLRCIPAIKDKVALIKRQECKNILSPQEFCYPHRTFLFKIMNLCTKYNVRLLSVTAFKDKLLRKDPVWLYPACIKILSGTYHRYLAQKGNRGTIILDARGDSLDDTLTFFQSSFLLWGKDGRLLDRIVETPFFAPSHLSAPLQIAHYFAYIAAKQYTCLRYKVTKYNYILPLWQKMSGMLNGKAKGTEIINWS